MSDGSEMFGQLMLESLLARRSASAAQVLPQGSLWIGILLIVAAIAPLAIGAIIVNGPGERSVVAVKLDPANGPLGWESTTKAAAEPAHFPAPATAQIEHVASIK